jgi:D5 N terminal like
MSAPNAERAAASVASLPAAIEGGDCYEAPKPNGDSRWRLCNYDGPWKSGPLTSAPDGHEAGDSCNALVVVEWAATLDAIEGGDGCRVCGEHEAAPIARNGELDEPVTKAKRTRKPKAVDATVYIGEKWTELGNSHQLVYHHGDDIRFVHPLKDWFIWNGIYWRRDDDAEIMRRAEWTIETLFNEAGLITDDATRQAFRKFALKSQSHAQIRAMVQLAQHSSYVVVSPNALDANPMLLGVINGTVELTTGKFREGQREDYITKQAAVAFDRSAECPNWIAFQKNRGRECRTYCL